jgi:hypothetical protein
VEWHLSQESVAKMVTCPLGKPVAVTPWQFLQVPGTTPVWSKLAGNQAVVRWHLSQESVAKMVMCPFGKPVALTPWQFLQVPGTTPV